MKTIARLKSELAEAAGVSMGTFRNWLKNEEEELGKRGVRKHDKLLNPSAVKYLCEKYCIEFEEQK